MAAVAGGSGDGGSGGWQDPFGPPRDDLPPFQEEEDEDDEESDYRTAQHNIALEAKPPLPNNID